jgi:GT2 family glycosyltransferase
MKDATLTLSTIIVSYNTVDLTCHAVQSVLDEYRHSNIDGEVIVVDNASTDDSTHQLKRLFHDHVRLIESDRNLGFAGGNNLGINAAKGRYIFLLNSDTTVHPGAIKNMLKMFTKYPDKDTAEQEHTDEIDRLGIVSCKLLNLDGTLQKQGGALPSLKTIIYWWLLPLPSSVFSFSPQNSYHIEQEDFFHKEQKIGWVGGTAMMIRREVIDEIGVLDEGIFMYAEDVEYCQRATDHHWDILYTPEGEITHFGSASSSSDRAIIGEILGVYYVAQKHFSAWEATMVRKILRLGCLLRLFLFGIMQGNEKKKKLYQEAFQKLTAFSEN